MKKVPSILHLEDSDGDALLIEHELRRAGLEHTLRRVADGAEFRAAFAGARPDVVLADYKVPGFCGDAALALVREISPELPFICVSGTIGEELAVELMKAGATDYVLKDRLERLPRALRRALNEAEQREGRRHAEEALRASDQQFHMLADAMPQLAWMARPDGFITWYNQRWYEYTGTTPQQMEGWGWQSVHDPEVLPQVLERWKASIATGDPFEMTFPLRGADGVFRPFLTRVTPLKDQPGRVLQWFGTNTDVDELKRTQEASARLAAIVESSDDAIIGQDLHGIITSWNHGAARLFGYTEQEAVGQSVRRLIPADLAEEETRIRDILRRGNSIQNYETTRRRKNGTPVEVSLTISPIKNARGEIVGASEIARDITERKRLEQELRINNEKLHSSSEELQTQNEELIAISEELRANNEQLETRVLERTAQLRALAVELTQSEERERRRIAQLLHDELQQLLVGATVHLEIMRKGKDPKSCLEAMVRVEQLLCASNDVARGLSHELSPVALQQGNLAGALKWLAGWMEQNHRLSVRVEGEAITAPLEDSVKVLLFQSVRELLFNVVKHAGVKRAKVRLTETGEGQLEILVSDQGKGFDAARTSNGGETSTGLGLFSIRERLHLLGGRMEMQSASGRGSQFRLLAPLQKPPQSNAAPRPPLPAPRAKARPAVARAEPAKIRVVLADDHKVMRDGLVALLAHQSEIEVVGVASNGRDAIKQARKLQPDLVIMDINMPHLDGIQATREITAEWPGIKVIGLTMHTDTLRHEAMLKAGAVNCLSKNTVSRDLIKTIQAAFAAALKASGKRFPRKAAGGTRLPAE